jgi:hypothetical protein
MGFILVALMLAVLGVLIVGIVLMGIGGKTNFKYSNKLMFTRVLLQGLVLLVLVIAYFIGRSK